MSLAFGTEFTAQSSQAGTADTEVTAGTTEIDVGTGSNAAGAHLLKFELDVTSAPSTATRVDLYLNEGNTTGTYSAPRYVGSFVNIGTSADLYSLTIPVEFEFATTSWIPIGYNLTATLRCVPISAA